MARGRTAAARDHFPSDCDSSSGWEAVGGGLRAVGCGRWLGVVGGADGILMAAAADPTVLDSATFYPPLPFDIFIFYLISLLVFNSPRSVVVLGGYFSSQLPYS